MIARPARQSDLMVIAKILEECGIAAGMDTSEFTGICLVCERGGEVIGFAQAIPAKPVAFFSLLAVLPTYQKTRAAYKLVEGIELLLRAAGCKEWSAFVDADNASWMKTVQAWGADLSGNPGHLLRKDLNQ